VNSTSSTSHGRGSKDRHWQTFTEGRQEMAEGEEFEIWIVEVDGSSNKKHSGGGLVLTFLAGAKMGYALQLKFNATNNDRATN
jgi:hypothetical protein